MLAAACSGDDAATTEPPGTSDTIAGTTTLAPSTTSSTTSTTSSTTTTTTIAAGFVSFSHEAFTMLIPETWTENPEFPAAGAGFRESHTAFALPPTSLDISLENQEAGFDLDAHVEQVQADVAFFVPDFRVLESGEQDVDGARSLWFEYSEEFDGFPVVIREQVALRDSLLVTFTLISPVEFFEFDAGQMQTVIESFRFS